MTIQQFAKRFGMTFTPDVLQAADYLERKGHRFGVDFGYDTAIEMAHATKRMTRSVAQRRAKKRRRRMVKAKN